MVTNFSQKDERWKKLKINKTNLTLETHGCFICALSSLLDQTPDITLEALNNANSFNSDGFLLSDVAAKSLGLKYMGKSKTKPTFYPTIAETDHYKDKGYPQHFFTVVDKSRISDPLDGCEKDNPYKIVSYRLFKTKVKPESVYPYRPPDYIEQKPLKEDVRTADMPLCPLALNGTVLRHVPLKIPSTSSLEPETQPNANLTLFSKGWEGLVLWLKNLLKKWKT